MRMQPSGWLAGVGVAMALSSCAAAETKSAAGGQAYAGWYMEQGGKASLLPCGESKAWPIADSSDLRVKAKASGLSTDNPLYVRVKGNQTAGALEISSVEQVGSPTPIRDCPMTGVVTQSPVGG